MEQHGVNLPFCLQAWYKKCHPGERELCTSKLVCHIAFKDTLDKVAKILVKLSQGSHIISENTGIKYLMVLEVYVNKAIGRADTVISKFLILCYD